MVSQIGKLMAILKWTITREISDVGPTHQWLVKHPRILSKPLPKSSSRAQDLARGCSDSMKFLSNTHHSRIEIDGAEMTVSLVTFLQLYFTPLATTRLGPISHLKNLATPQPSLKIIIPVALQQFPDFILIFVIRLFILKLFIVILFPLEL